ncbi:site-specific integrase [Mucilaginibacter sp. BJC16-A38]|uniref:site-specific integrase n=1 Tax=Mucilaginibacter phenanthrenivorans TaxID=1234842 RepID=UPI002157EB5E|nr:site-specific integrase [Mucilaginibacter phenanthrenivorans]MCR8561076.1 site-specific integrase [Mucilaginibacter phenanthrenivorans]
MATVRFYLRKKVLSDGTSPLVLKIYKDGKPSINHTDIRLFHRDWDAKKRRVKTTHLNHTKLNNYLLKKLAEANNTAIEMQTANDNVSSKAVIRKIKPNSATSFFKFGEEYGKSLKKAGKYTERNSAIASMEHFKNFLNGSDIIFPEITVSLLDRYKAYLANDVKIGKKQKNMSPVTVNNKLSFIRELFNSAITASVVEQKYYPFGEGGMEIKAPETAKHGLSMADVLLIESVELTNRKYNHARNLWLISFYFGGMRASDVLRLKWSDFKDNRLHYTMGKNHKPGSLVISKNVVQKVENILFQYEDEKRGPNDFIFPDLKELPNFASKFEIKKFISTRVSAISTVLRNYVGPAAGLMHPLTMHISRHAFGNVAGEMNISLLMLQKIFRHSIILTTMNYMKNFIHKEADEAMDAVLNFEPVNINKPSSTAAMQMVG